jgi:hypothetical protein
MFAFWKSRRERPIGLYFFCISAPLYFGYWLFSLHSRVLPNWPVAAVPPMFCLMAVYWDEKFRHGARFVKYFLIAGLALGFIMAIFMFNTNLIGKVTGQLLPAEKDPLRRVRGWKQTAACAETARETLANQGTPAFIIADHYSTTALVTFYLPEARATLTTEPLVYCIDSDQPVNQLYFWPEYNYSTHRKGENAILISEVGTYPLENNWFWKWLMHKKVGYGDVPPPAPAPKQIFGQFETITDLGEKEIKVGNRILRRVHLWACYNLK